MAEIVCKNLSVGYDGKTVASNIDFEVNSGDYLCVVGKNGAGKSTLIRTVLGLQKPLSGEMIYGEGVERCGIGYIPQRTEAQKDFPASVYEIVLSGCLGGLGFHPFYGKKHKTLAMKNIEIFGMKEYADKCFRELSGGQQQRVLLARAICATEKMLLLDEPVAGLDPIATRDLYEVIEKINRENKITVIMITHDISAALRYASHILYVGEGNFFGFKEKFVASDFFKKIKSEED